MVLLLSLFSDAEACSFMGHEPYETVEDGGDTDPPGAPVLGEALITRGVGPEGVFIQSATSCDDLGWITIELTEPDDDDALGYTMEVVAGTTPDGFSLPQSPFHLVESGLILVWIDDATDDQEAFDFTLAVTAMDPAGNEGPADEIQLTDGGSGCGVAGLSGSWLLGLMLLGRRRC